MNRIGDFVWRTVYRDGYTLHLIAYAPAGATRPELRDVVPDAADVREAVARLAQGRRPVVVGTWEDLTNG